ncbi:MAG: nucleotidyltransferase family protein [Clostridiales bacterium]|nr:nucleotidyltransferase family protein [Clostridiales bacterium]
MKICAIICEYNPFHNGHLFQLNAAKERSNADAVVCFMSGSFVQRGEAAIMDKYTRAKHAVLAGADAVIELPTVFSTANAELFAKGATHLLTSIPDVKYLCFGAENADKLAFVSAARYLNDEPEDVSSAIKNLMDTGISYAKARAQAFAGFIPINLLSSPNNILGIEYTKSLLEKGSDVDILPIQRIGSGYSTPELENDFSSATAIRNAIFNGENIEKNIPDFVRKDLPEKLENCLDNIEKYAVLVKNKEDISRVCDCNEGLENAFKKAALESKTLVENLTSTRYTSSRIRRIALQNLLNIEKSLIRGCLASPLYLRLLAVNKERSDVLSSLSQSPFPIISRAHDENVLSGVAKACFEKDVFAENVRNVLYKTTAQEKNIFI